MPDVGASGIVPRWEWRVFAPSLKDLRDLMKFDGSGPERASNETYILFAGNSHNAKIRGGVLDIKALQKVEWDGLELWKPIFQRAFPIVAEDVAQVLAILQFPAPKLILKQYDELSFLHDVVGACQGVKTIAITKHRSGFQYLGCTAEFSRVTTPSVSLETLSFEHEDPQLMINAIRSIGQECRSNTSYPIALRRLV